MKTMNTLLILALTGAISLVSALETGNQADGKKTSTQLEAADSSSVKDSTALPQELPAPKTLENGIKIEILTLGSGDSAEVGDVLELHYVGKLANGGNEFDNSYTRGQPFSFVLGGKKVIEGWDIGLVGMKVGEKRKLFVPAALAYGSRNLGIIPPNSDLDFEVELLSKKTGLKPDVFPKHQLFQWQSKRPGVEIYVEAEGQGPAAKSGDAIVVHYTGWLMGGTEVQSSVRSGEEATFTLGAGEVIRGWEQGLVGAKAGEVRYLKIAPQLAYGANPQSRIPPNSPLLYKIRILEIKEATLSDDRDVFPDLATTKWEGPAGDLQYFEIKSAPEGSPLPQVGRKVSVHYTGWLEDGSMFDSSRRRGAPFEFTLGGNQVIRGWDLAIQKMPIGTKGLLKIPSHLGYGNKGAGSIPAGATLIFMVEVLESK